MILLGFWLAKYWQGMAIVLLGLARDKFLEQEEGARDDTFVDIL